MADEANTEKAIFLNALEKPTPAEQTAYLEEACAGDAALRRRVLALLDAAAHPDSVLDHPAAATSITANRGSAAKETSDDAHGDRAMARPAAADERLTFLAPSDMPGSLGRLDHYEVLEIVGQGVMGIVLKARDTKLQRIVAIKAMAPHLAINGTARKRFVREAQAAAAVRDEHVVDIYAVQGDEAVPYLVMEYIEGITLADRMQATGPMELRELLRIGMQIAMGLAAAHAQGLVHRDVKPANILLENGVQRVKITDFGLARLADDASLTQSGMIAGTPLYMSPEQARGEVLDHRADLFSLGSVLYAMAAGRPPFRAANTLAVMKRVCEDTPRPIREINPDVPEWLAALVNRLLAKSPGERYQSAREVARLLSKGLAELQAGRPLPVSPVIARAVPAAPIVSLPRRPQRSLWPALIVAGGVLVVAVLLLAVAGVSYFWWQNQPANPGVEVSQAKKTVRLTANPLDRRSQAQIPPQLLALAGDPNQVPSQLVAMLDDHTGHVMGVAFSPDGQTLASAGEDRTIRVWDLAAWKADQPAPPVRTLVGHADQVMALAFSPDGRWLASASSDGTVAVWNVATGTETRTVKGTAKNALRVAFTPDSKTLAAGCADGKIKLLDLPSGKEEYALSTHAARVRCVAISRNGKLLASGGDDKTVQLCDMASGRCLATLAMPNFVNNVAFADDNRTLAAVCDHPDGVVRLWDVETPREAKEMTTLTGHTGHIYGLAFRPDSNVLATGSDDGTVRLWQPTAAAPVLTIGPGPFGVRVHNVAFTPDGRYLATSNQTGTVSILKIPQPLNAPAQ